MVRVLTSLKTDNHSRMQVSFYFYLRVIKPVYPTMEKINIRVLP